MTFFFLIMLATISAPVVGFMVGVVLWSLSGVSTLAARLQ